MMILTSWSSQGLIAHYDPSQSGSEITLIDQNVGICDPFYRQTLKLTDNSTSLALMQWNSIGTHLLAVTQNGSIEIFRQSFGLVNQWESIYRLARNSPPIYSIWCENRRKFSFNSNSNNNAADYTVETNAFSSKVFHLNFVPSGRNCFLLISSNGSIEIFLESSTADKFDIFNINIPFQLTLKDGFAYQRPNGKILIFLRSNELWTIYEVDGSDLKAIQLISQKEIKTTESSLQKFIWSEAKESLIHLEMVGTNCLKMSFYTTNLDESPSSKLIDLPFKINGIYNSTRAANSIFLKSSQDQGTVLIMNLNGEIVKQLSMDHERTEFTEEEDEQENSNLCDNLYPVIISPNGLVLAKIDNFDGFPLIINSPIGEIHPKNVQMIRDFLGKLISSTLNNLDSWDIFQLIRRSLQKCPEEDLFPFISTILGEWIHLLDLANLPARDFYPKLLDLFKTIPCGFDAYAVVDIGIKFSCLEKIILANLINFNNEDYLYSETTVTKWPEIEQVSIEPESLISLVPILEEGLKLIKSIEESPINCSHLLPLNEEIHKSIGLIWITSQVTHKQIKLKLTNDNNKKLLLDFYYQVDGNFKENISHLDSFINYLISLKSDTQIQAKFTKNLFHFLTEFYLDSTNLKKVSTILQRISSRFNTNTNNTTRIEKPKTTSISTIFDSIKFLNLPLRPNSSILICRKCHRTSLNSKVNKSRRELIFAADWQQTLWKMRCQCGSLRRQV